MTGLALAPGFVDPLTQLVALSFAEKQPDQALDRLRKQAALLPRSAMHQLLLGEAHRARREGKLAEAAYLKAIELEPRLAGPYLRLGRLHAASGQFDHALAKVAEALKGNPNPMPARSCSAAPSTSGGAISRRPASSTRRCWL